MKSISHKNITVRICDPTFTGKVQSTCKPLNATSFLTRRVKSLCTYGV